MTPFPSLLRTLRTRAGLSQSRLAELADYDHSFLVRPEPREDEWSYDDLLALLRDRIAG